MFPLMVNLINKKTWQYELNAYNVLHKVKKPYTTKLNKEKKWKY